MATDYEAYKDQTQRRPGARRLLLLPPLLLIAACLVLIAVSPFSWGAAEVIDAPDWMPPVLGILTAIGGLLVGWSSLRRTLNETRGNFDVFVLQTAFGILLFVAGAVLMVFLALQLPDSDTYARAIDDQGEIQISPLGYFLVSLILGAFQIALVWIGAYLYSHAFTNQAPTRLSARDPNEVDGIAQLLRERQ